MKRGTRVPSSSMKLNEHEADIILHHITGKPDKLPDNYATLRNDLVTKIARLRRHERKRTFCGYTGPFLARSPQMRQAT